MKPKTTILMVLAIGCGLAAAFMTQRLLAERNKAPEAEPVEVVIVKKTIPAQTFIKDPEEFFTIEKKPADGVHSSAIRDLKNVTNIRVNRTIKEGDYIRTDDVETKEALGLITDIPENMRSVAIRVNAEKLSGGFVLPKYRVDVVWTHKLPSGEAEALTILQNMEVLAVDTQTRKNSTEGTPTIIGQTVTIAVTPEEAQHLLLAKENGEVSLLVRPPGADKKQSVRATKIGDIGTRRDAINEPRESADPNAQASDGSKAAPLVKLPAKVEPVKVEQEKPKEEPKPVVVETPKPEIHTIQFVKGDGEVVEWHYPKHTAKGGTGVDLKKTPLDEPKKSEPQLESSSEKK